MHSRTICQLCCMPLSGCASMAAVTTARPPACVARCRRASAASASASPSSDASPPPSPMHTLSCTKRQTPDPARILHARQRHPRMGPHRLNRLDHPASAAACALSSDRHSSWSCKHAPSVTRATAMCTYSAATASASPILATFASLGASSPFTDEFTRRQLFVLIASALGPTLRVAFPPPPPRPPPLSPPGPLLAAVASSVAAAAPAVRRLGQASRCDAIAPRVVASPQCSQRASRAAIACSTAVFRLA